MEDGRGVGLDGGGRVGGRGSAGAPNTGVVGVCLFLISSLHLAATLAALPGSAASRAAAAANPSLCPGRSCGRWLALEWRRRPRRSFAGARFIAGCGTVATVAVGVENWEGGGGVGEMAFPLPAALLVENARRACACLRATSCGVGGGLGVSGSGAVSCLPFALLPLFFFFTGGSWEVVVEDGVGMELWDTGTYSSSLSPSSSSVWPMNIGVLVPTPQSRTTSSYRRVGGRYGAPLSMAKPPGA